MFCEPTLSFCFRTMLGGDDQGVDGRIDYASFTEAFLRVAGESESFALIALQSGNSPSLKNVLGSWWGSDTFYSMDTSSSICAI